MSRAASAEHRVLLGRLVRTAALALGAALLLAAWTGWQLMQAGRELQRAATGLTSARADLSGAEGALPAVAEAAAGTAQARERVEDPLVRLVAELPWAGRTVDVATAVAVSTDAAIADAVQPLLEAAGTEPFARLLPGGGRVDVDYVAALAAPSAAASATLESAQTGLRDAPSSSGIQRLDAARNDLDQELDRLGDLVDQLSLATRLVPSVLGGGEPRRFLLVPQNPAEARGTGGIYGGFVLLEADEGKVRVLDSGPSSALQKPRVSVLDLNAEFDEHYGHNGPTLGWVNANLSPHFPYAAKIWSALWERQTGEELAGVVTLDPVALSYLLRATGPVTTPDGTRVSTDNVVSLTLRDVYARFANDNPARDEFLQQVVAATADAVLTEQVPPRPLLNALSQAVEERRLLFWSRDEALQDALGDRALSGRLPNGVPAVGDVIVNSGANKLDYYLDRAVAYAPACDAGPSSLSLLLRNTGPTQGLPDYVTLPQFRNGLPPGTNQSTVTLYVPGDARVGELRQDGQVIPFRQGTELGLRWVEVLVTLPPGDASELVLDFQEEQVAGEQITQIRQPLVRPERFSITSCS